MEQGLKFTRVPQVNVFGSLPEADEYDKNDLGVLYDPNRGFVDSHEEGGARFFGESSALSFSQTLSKGASQADVPPGRRPEFWTTHGVSSTCLTILTLVYPPSSGCSPS